jgi:ribokinase
MVVGSTMVDMIAYVKTIPKEGQTIVGQSFSLGFGGKGANQAVMARLLGASVLMVNCVGDDLFGPSTVENMASLGIDSKFVWTIPGTSSGVAPIWVEQDGSNRIIVVPGANDRLSLPQVDQAFEYFGPPDVVLSQLEVPQAAILRAFERGTAAGAVNILNPAPAAPVDPAILRLTSWLIPNESEFGALCASLGIEIPSWPDAVVTAAHTLGVSLLLTLGAQGALYCEAASNAAVHVPAVPVTAIDTTGAGDAFVGAFAYAIASGQPPVIATALGMACAGASVTRKGTQTSFPRDEDLHELSNRIIGSPDGESMPATAVSTTG